MSFYKHHLHTIKSTTKLQNHAKQARGRYFNSQQERFLIAVKSVREEKIKQINDDISSINKSIFQTQEAIESMKETGDGHVFEAENKSNITELRNLISKSTVLKRNAEEKQSVHDGLSEMK